MIEEMSVKKISKITTRGGDGGESSLADGERRRKDDLFFETLGSIDELISHIGLLRAGLASLSVIGSNSPTGQEEILILIQKRLQTAAGMVAAGVVATGRGAAGELPAGMAAESKSSGRSVADPKLGDGELGEREAWERELMEGTTITEAFVQPGAGILSAQAHVARTVCRRAERRVVSCIDDRELPHLEAAQRYLNRLSDYLFVLALWLEQREGPDI